jgi:hypothetical protein
MHDVIASGAVEIVGSSTLKDKLLEFVSNHDVYTQRAALGRELFVSQFSYARNREQLWDSMQQAQDSGNTIPPEYEQLVDFHRQVFTTVPVKRGVAL